MRSLDGATASDTRPKVFRLILTLALLASVPLGPAFADGARDNTPPETASSLGGASAPWLPARQPETLGLAGESISDVAIAYPGLLVGMSFTPRPFAGFDAAEQSVQLWASPGASPAGARGLIAFDMPYTRGELLLGGSYRNFDAAASAVMPPGFAAAIYNDASRSYSWDAGLKYAFGNWSIGGSYFMGDSNPYHLPGWRDGRAYAVEGGYNIGSNIAFSAGVQVWEAQSQSVVAPPIDRAGPANGKYTVIFLETNVDF